MPYQLNPPINCLERVEVQEVINIWSNVHNVGSTPRHNDWLTVSHKVILTLIKRDPGFVKTLQPLPHFHHGRVIQIPKRPYAVLQLPEVWSRLGQLQTTSPLLVVWGKPPTQRLSGEGDCIFNTSMLQLPVGWRRDSTSRKLPQLQVC
jgi:hypothetical protein